MAIVNILSLSANGILSKSDISELTITWNNINNKPISTIIDIDDAVDKKHSHSNLSILSSISEDINNKPLWNDSEWPNKIQMYDTISILPEIGETDILYVIISDETKNNQPSLMLYYNDTYNYIINESSGGEGGVSRFIQLLDTPQVYSGNENKYTKVNSNGTGLEFVELHTSTPSTNGILGAQVARRYSIIYGIG